MPFPTWQKSSYSAQGNNCVELAAVEGVLRVRESDVPTRSLAVAPERFGAFMRLAKANALGL